VILCDGKHLMFFFSLTTQDCRVKTSSTVVGPFITRGPVFCFYLQ
jgi:hypothetical protein